MTSDRDTSQRNLSSVLHNYTFGLAELCVPVADVAGRCSSHHEETRELPGERYNARNNARCTHGLGGQHQDADRTLRRRVSQNDEGQG